MVMKFLVRIPFALLLMALLSLLATTLFTPSAGFAHPEETRPPAETVSPSPTTAPSPAAPTDTPTQPAPSSEPSQLEPTPTPEERDHDIDVGLEIYDANQRLLNDAVISDDHELIVSATIRDAELTQLFDGEDDIEDETAFEVEVGLPNADPQIIAYEFGDLEPKLDDDDDPITDTYWINPATVDTDDWVQKLPDEANGAITVATSYNRHGALEDPVVAEETAVYLDTTSPLIDALTYVTPEDSHRDVLADDYLVANGQRYLEFSVADEQTDDAELRDRFTDLWRVIEVHVTHDGDPVDTETVTDGETYRIVLDESMEYELEYLSISVTDTAGNIGTYDAQERNSELNTGRDQIPSTIAIDHPASHWYTRVLVDDGTQEHSGRDLVINHGTPDIVLESNKPFLPHLVQQAAHDDGWRGKPALNFEHSYGSHRLEVQVTCDDTEPQASDDGIYRVRCSLPTEFDGGVSEGAYSLDETSLDERDDIQWSNTTGYIEGTDFTLDTTAPEASVTTRPDPAAFDLIDELTGDHTEHKPYRGETLLISRSGDSIGYELAIKDLLPPGHPGRDDAASAAQTGTSGLDITSVEVSLPAPTDLDGEPLGRSITQSPEVSPEGDVLVEFPPEGIYDLSQVTISAQDQAGNALDSLSLDTLLDESGPRLVAAVPTETSATAGAEITRADGVPASTDEATYFRGDVNITFTINDRWFPLYRALADDVDALLTLRYAYTLDPAGETVTDLDLDPENFVRGKNHTWVYTDVELPRAADSDQPLEARYQLSWHYPGLNPLAGSETSGHHTFWVDYTSPVITETAADIHDHFWFVDELPETHIQHANYDGEPLLVSPTGDTVRYRVNIKDLFPAEHPAHHEPTGTTHSHAGAAGLETASVQFRVPERTDLHGERLGQAETTHPAITDHGTFWIELSGEGLYDLTEVVISANDHAGNALEPVSLYEALHAEDSPHHKFVVVNRGESPVKADLTIARADGVPASPDNSYYFRGDIDSELTVTDRWFPLYLAHEEDLDTLVTLGYNASPASLDPMQQTGVTFNPTRFTPGEEYQWVYQELQLPRASGSAQPLEAQYALSWNYQGLNTAADNSKTSGRHDFIVDYTGPQLGELQFSDLSDIQDEWIVADDAYNVTLHDVTDQVAGIDPDSVGFHRFADHDWQNPDSRTGFDPGVSDLEEHPKPAPKYAGSDDYAGQISFDLTGNSQRLYLNQTVIGLTDKAGNPVDTGLLNRYEPTQLELRLNPDDIYEGPHAIAIASADPTLNVSYDHDDVRNGHYYNAERTATITVTDANFDLLQHVDGFATVMTAAVDDGERTVNAEDFSNPSGDRQTWVATHEFDTDGDWDMTAQATTISGKTSEAFTDAWTLDTLDPMIMVDFDPEMGEAGQYFNSVRTATVTINERNFSPDHTSVVVSAETADGGAAPAPSGTGWAEVDEYEWAQTFTFANELVYEMTIDTVDLAGNTTDTYEVPEFIVDLTAPDVQITQVQDATAYAGVVAPQVEVADTYLSPSQVEYVLEGFNQGPIDSSTHFVSEDFDETSWSATWDDFPRDIPVDDIYTLSVKATDMAGNTTSDAVTFSVNRFGSTYMFSDGTSNLRGQYLQEPVEVDITEINVSGLSPELTEVSVVENDLVQTLDGDDFVRKDVSVEGGWQATQYTLPASLFDSSAYFRIMLSSVDVAGNLSQNTMASKDADRESSAEVKFAVDQVAPHVTLGDIESGSVYYAPVKNIIPDAKDNLALESLAMTIDGDTVLEASGSEALTEILAHQLPADAQEHTIVVSATDKAGNVSQATYTNVLIAANFWQHLTSQPMLAAGLVAGSLALLAAVIMTIVSLVRRRRRLAYRRNPFGL